MTLKEQLHRMEQDLQLRGMSASTQFNYLRAVRKYLLPTVQKLTKSRGIKVYQDNIKTYLSCLNI